MTTKDNPLIIGIRLKDVFTGVVNETQITEEQWDYLVMQVETARRNQRKERKLDA